MNWALLAGSLASVLGLVLVARLLRLGEASLADAAEAMRIAEEEVPGFVAVSAVVAEDGQSAVVIGADGAEVRLRRFGAGFIAEP